MKRLMYASFFLLTCCTQEGNNIPDDSGTDEPVPLTVATVSIEGERTDPNTRATVLPVPVTSGKLGMGVRARNGYTAQTGVVYTYADGAWTSATLLALSKDPVSLYAYWPQDGYSLNTADNTVSLLTQPYAADKDLSYALSGGDNVCVVHPYAGFVMKHAYSRVRVEIFFSPLIDVTSVLESVTVAATGLLNDGKQNIENGTFTPGGPATELKWKPGVALNTLTGNSSTGYTFVGDILVVPSATLTDAKLSISLGGFNYVSDMSAALVSLEAGKRYRIRAKMGYDLIIDGIDKEVWTEVGEQNGDTRYETGVPPMMNDNMLIDQWTNGSSASGDTELQ